MISEKLFISDHSLSHFIYPFVHLNDAPFFSHFSNDSNHENYQKKYIFKNFEVYTLNSILETETQITWNIKIERFNCGSFSYGITIAIDNNIPVDIDGEPVTRVSNFNDVSTQRWKEQKELKIPLLQCMSKGKPILICTNPNHPVRFFYFDEGIQKYLKIEFKSNSIKNDIIISKNHGNPYEAYCSFYKEHKSSIYFSNICFKKMSQYYGSKINIKEINYDLHSLSMPSQNEIELYSEILWKEMLIYPKDIFRILNIKNIYLYSHNTDPSGFYDGNIYLNISSVISNTQKITTIHHEIFHAIEKKTNQIHNEDLAIIYGYLIYDQNYIDEKIINNKKLRKNISDVFKILRKIDSSLPYFIKSSRKNSINVTKTKDIYYKSREKIIEIASNLEKNKINGITKYTPKHEKFVFIGMSGSGLSLISKIFDNKVCLNITNDYDNVVLVRNPIDICVRNYNKFGDSVEFTYKKWVEIYSEFMEKNLPYLRFEDIVLGNYSKVKNTLSAWNVKVYPWMKYVNLDIVKYNWKEISGISLIIEEFVNTKYAWYYRYENLEEING